MRHSPSPAAAGEGWARLLVKAGITLAILSLWEALPRLGIVHPIVLAPPSAVVAAAVRDWPVFLAGLRITLLEALTAIILSWAIGLGLGVALGSSARLGGFAVPPLESAFAMPWVVLYPLLILWLGIGSPSKVLFATVSATFPILLTTIAAVSTVDSRCLLLARALKATRLQTYVKILVPFALPQILAGLRLGTAVAVIAVLVGEMLTSVGGLGFVITYNRTQFETGHVYFGLVLAIGMALGANWLMGLVEGRLAWWAETTK